MKSELARIDEVSAPGGVSVSSWVQDAMLPPGQVVGGRLSRPKPRRRSSMISIRDLARLGYDTTLDMSYASGLNPDKHSDNFLALLDGVKTALETKYPGFVFEAIDVSGEKTVVACVSILGLSHEDVWGKDGKSRPWQDISSSPELFTVVYAGKTYDTRGLTKDILIELSDFCARTGREVPGLRHFGPEQEDRPDILITEIDGRKMFIGAAGLKAASRKGGSKYPVSGDKHHPLYEIDDLSVGVRQTEGFYFYPCVVLSDKA